MKTYPSILAALLALSTLLFVTSCQQPPAPPPVPVGGVDDCQLFFDNTNIQAVNNGANAPRFVLTPQDPSLLCGLQTYHWNGGAGQAPGQIGLRNLTTGQVYGPYQATGSPGQGGAPNVNWRVLLSPRIELRPGVYEVIDSHPASWSWNAQSLDKSTPPRASGFALVWLTIAE
jgi:hypothetical protein